MPTECIPEQLEFQGFGRRKVVADFSGGAMSSDAGALLVREVEQGAHILRGFARCFTDHRNPKLIEHTVLELISQRTYGLVLGYEDLNDHDDLRHDSLLATLVGKTDPTGADRLRKRDKGCPLAGKSTLNRFEFAFTNDPKSNRYHKIECDPSAVDRFFVETFLRTHKTAPRSIVLDLDATDDPLHGSQEGGFFHGYYGCYCYLPLYIFCGDDLLCARLRPANVGAAFGAEVELERIVDQIRAQWPDVLIIVRGDSDYATDPLMTWCETNNVFYVFGKARNPRLVKEIEEQLKRAMKKYWLTGESARCYRDFRYRTLDSWSRTRRVVGKAEYLPKGQNPRFVVTNLSRKDFDARSLYEDLYCARGEMENRIKEQQLGLFSDRTSSNSFAANHLRLWFSSVAYLLLNQLRRVGLKGTTLERAQCSTIRTKLLKIGARIHISVRRVWARCSSGYPYQQLFATILANIRDHYFPLRV